MVTSYGMSEVLGPLAYQKQQNQFLGGMEMARNVSPATSEAIDKEIKTIVENAHAKALAILNANRDLLESISEKLLETEVIEGEFLAGLLSQVKSAEVNT
ncbi:MAG: cell division protein FtsH, partial [Microcystis sp. M53BS1]|nr:cell division protein FtsH [Microcystis sp. M53BS1]